MQKAMERSVRKAKALVVMTQTVVLASVRHLRGNIENRPTRVAVGEALRTYHISLHNLLDLPLRLIKVFLNLYTLTILFFNLHN